MVEREEIIRRQQVVETYQQIANEMRLPYMTVRGICKHYERSGKVQPNYEACAKPGVRKDVAIYEGAIQLKQAHPRWGAGLIWVELAEGFAEEQLPSDGSLQRWFHRAGVAGRVVSEKREVCKVQRGQVAHEVWAMDAKEEIQLGDGTYAHLWDVVQAASFLATYRFYRKVEKNGRINLLANTYSVGQDFARQTVTIRLDVPSRDWLILDDYGNLLVRHPSKELDYGTLYYDKLGQRRNV